MTDAYRQFLERKVCAAPSYGFGIADADVKLIYDPFAGLATVPYRAILKGRRGLGCELSTPYWLDGAAYCKAAELQVGMPDLFALADREHEDAT